jgi:hypothetical protein
MIDFKEKTEQCAAEIVRTKPHSVHAIAMLVKHKFPDGEAVDLRLYVAVYRRVMEIDPNNIARDMLEGTPTLTPLEIDAYARKLMRTPHVKHRSRKVTGHLAIADRILVLARIGDMKAGNIRVQAGVVPFVLKELP